MASSQAWFSIGELVGGTERFPSHYRGMTLAEKLRKARIGAGLTQAEAAARLGIKAPSIAEWELGDSKPRISRIPEIAKIYNVSVEELVGPGGITTQLVTRDEIERSAIELLRSMTDDARKAGLSVMRTLANRSS